MSSSSAAARSIVVEGADPDGNHLTFELSVEEIVDGHSSAWCCTAPDGRSTWSRNGAMHAAYEFVAQLAVEREVLPETVTIRVAGSDAQAQALWL